MNRDYNYHIISPQMLPVLFILIVVAVFVKILSHKDSEYNKPRNESIEVTVPYESIDLNFADVEDLKEIGMPTNIAIRVVQYRDIYGPYMEVEELLNVPGIGETNLKKWSKYLIVN